MWVQNLKKIFKYLQFVRFNKKILYKSFGRPYKRNLKMRLQIFADLSKDLNIVSLFITIKTEAATVRCSVKKGVLKHFAKFTTLLKKRLWHGCFPVNMAKV